MKLRIKGEELRRHRLAKLMSQDELALRSRLTQQTISKLEIGTDAVLTSTVRVLAEALACKPEDISEVVAAEATA